MSEQIDTMLLQKLRAFKENGERAHDDWKDEREAGINVWNGQFSSGTQPDNTFYYPKMYSLLRHYVRAARKTYSSAPDIVSVLPEGRSAVEIEQLIAEKQREEINYHLRRWNSFLTFIDDTFTQAIKIGVACGKVWWEQETEIEQFEVATGEEEFNEETGVWEPQTETREREIITRNKLMIDYIDIDDLLWDPTARKWDDVRWCIHRNIEYSGSELLEMIDTDGYDRDMVEKLIASPYAHVDEDDDVEDGNTNVNPELHIFKLSEFWGQIQVPKTIDEDMSEVRETKFVKIVADNEFKFVLKGPTENVYTYIDGEPMNPFEVWYLVRKEGQVRGESYCYKLRDLQGEINCIRNQRRKSVENDLNERYVFDKNAEVEFTKMDDSDHGVMISVNDINNGFKEITHKDNTSTSYNELAIVDQDIDQMTGITAYALGMADPSVTDTLGGIQIMSTASNTVIYDNILSYNEGLERLLTKGLHLSLQYLTVEELEADGIEMPQNISRDQMLRRMRLRIDTGVGATSEMVEINNKTKAMFMTMSAIDWMKNHGVETGPMVYNISRLLSDIYPLLNIKNKEYYIPKPEELEQMTMKMIEMQQQMQQQQLQQAGQEVQQAAQQGAQGGMQAGIEMAENGGFDGQEA